MVYKCKNCGNTTQHIDDKGFCINCTKEKEYTNEDFKLIDENIDKLFKRVDELNDLVDKTLLEMQKLTIKTEACAKALAKLRGVK